MIKNLILRAHKAFKHIIVGTKTTMTEEFSKDTNIP
jgi:hypothetical protein